MSKEIINVDRAFNPEARQAQIDFDAYLETRPVRDEGDNPENGTAVEEDILSSLAKKATELNEDGDVTKSFNLPVVAVHPMSKANRLGMLIDDIRDNVDYAFPPQAVECSGPDAAKLTERFLPQEAVAAIRRIGQHYDRGIYRRIDIVGDKESGTNHPHIYFLDKTVPGKTRMFFVDPEDKVAVNDKLRPSIANLVGVEVPDDESESAKVAVLRYRIPTYVPGVKQEGRGPDELKAVISEVIDNGDSLPEILTGDAENQVLFMIVGDDASSRVQARYSTRRQIESFAHGGRGSSALEGKVLMQVHVVNKLIRLFNQPSEARQVR